jgi:hypothetical protein
MAIGQIPFLNTNLAEERCRKVNIFCSIMQELCFFVLFPYSEICYF